MLDEETSKLISVIPEKKKSEYVRQAIKAYENSKSQAELDAARPKEKPIPTVRIRI